MPEEMVQFLRERVPGCEANAPERERGTRPIFINPKFIHSVCLALRDSLEYDMTTLQVITGCDYEEHIEVSYMLASFRKNTEVMIKVRLPKTSPVPEIESVCDIWAAANFQERECFDMVGVRFLKHPDLRRILCPDDWEGYPLRKDYKVQEVYRNMKVNPEDKINSGDHYFYKELQEKSAEPKKIIFSWKE